MPRVIVCGYTTPFLVGIFFFVGFWIELWRCVHKKPLPNDHHEEIYSYSDQVKFATFDKIIVSLALLLIKRFQDNQFHKLK